MDHHLPKDKELGQSRVAPMARDAFNEWPCGMRAASACDDSELIATAAKQHVVACVRRADREEKIRLSPAQARRVAAKLLKLADVVDASIAARSGGA